ncbi:hypothetical protein KQI65_05245 [bacterium]|nr:hypothetical protein [bacterium]
MVFWSTHCSPCLKELRRMNMLAQEHPEISFVWVSGQDDEKKIGKLADTLTAIHFIHDPDSTVWHEFNPESWGVAYAFDKSGTQFLKGYSSEITDGNINSIAMEKSITRRHSRIGYQFNFDTEVGFGAHEFSYIPHDNGEEVQLTNKSATSLVNYLLTSLYGNKVEIVERNEANASTPVKMIRLRLRYDEEQKKAAFERFLKMFCAGYGIVLDLEKSADGEVQKVIVDYSGYSG